MSEQKKQTTLYQKISNVMKNISYLEKDGIIKFGTTNYKAISEEKVTTSVREQLIKEGLVIIPFEQEHKKEGNLTTVDVKYKIIDIESGNFEIIASSGTGVDTQDKGVGKAMTYAYKYMLLRTFAIPTGEDPDKTSSAEIDASLEKQKKEFKEKQETKNPESNKCIACDEECSPKVTNYSKQNFKGVFCMNCQKSIREGRLKISNTGELIEEDLE